MQTFCKYHGAGNDFVLIEGDRSLSKDWIVAVCDRHRGIGADGVLQIFKNSEWTMRIYNADGGEASMCGNGLRCAALHTGASFLQTSAGPMDIERRKGCIASGHPYPHFLENPLIIDSGARHIVVATENLGGIDLVHEGRLLRQRYDANVTYFQNFQSGIAIRVYERGVEGETLACGTGALAAAWLYSDGKGEVDVTTKSGEILSVSFEKKAWVIGPAVKVFEGEVSIVFQEKHGARERATC